MKLRWVAVIVPCVAIGVLDLVTDHEWSDLVSAPVNTLIVPVLAVGGSTLFALILFRRIDALSDAIRERDAALERERATRAERDRIAHEMHDGLAQVLGYVNTKAQAAEERLAAGQTDEARKQLTELAAAARAVFVDVREAILGLSTHVDRERGLVGALEDYVPRFSESSKIAVSLRVTAAARDATLASGADSEIFQIAREALTNVRKHAAAHRVDLGIALEGRELVLTVADDGVGLHGYGHAGDWPHFGMTTISGRASSIGGVADWTPGPQSGTTFRLRVPVAAAVA